MRLLYEIMARLKGSGDLDKPAAISLKDAYMKPVQSVESTDREVLNNRLVVRNYLRDFDHYSSKPFTDF